MDWGMQNRMSRVIKPDGRCFFLAVDHGYFLGPTRGMEKPDETVNPLLPHCDALFVTRGVLRNCIDPETDTPIILRVSGGSSIVGDDLSDESLTVSIDEMLRLNVASVGISVFVGGKYQHRTLDSLSKLVDQCERYGIPVMAVTAVGKELGKEDARYLGLATRICAELGARVVKTYWCPEGFEDVVAGCPVPIVIAGGPKCDTEREVFDFIHDGISKGAIGVNLGRNVWQHPHPQAMMAGLNAIIHGNATPEEAVGVYEDAVKADA